MGGYYWYSDNPNCGRCGHLNGRGFCNMTACIYPVLPQTAVMTKHHLTNADRIRAMTDEELDRFLSGVHNNIGSGRAQIAVWNNSDRPIRIWRTGWLDWLKQEATE